MSGARGRELATAGVPDGISVVVPHYGDPALAEAAVAGVFAHAGLRPLQVVVVDDCSPEPFPERPGVVVRRHRTNRGFGAAVNTGVAEVAHPWLLVLNSDVDLGPGALEQLVLAAEQLEPAVCSPLLVEHGRPTSTANRWPAAFRGLAALQPLARWSDRPWMRRLVGFDDACTAGVRRRTDWLVGACLLLRTATFVAAGGFDERFHLYFEEIDLQHRLAEQGVPAWFVGDVAVTHLGGGTTGWSGRVRRLAVSHALYARIWGFHRRSTATAGATIGLNLAYNVLRRASGRPVTPLRSARTDLGHLLAGLRESRTALRRPRRTTP